MSKRLQVVMSEDEFDEIREAAERRRVTVSVWVRRVLREARSKVAGREARAVRESQATYGADGLQRVPVEVHLKRDLLDAVRERYRLPNERAAIEFALSRVAIQPMTREEVLSMQGVGWEGNLDETRSGDPGALW